MYSPEPVIHVVTPDSGWPLPVASLGNAIELPLPVCIQQAADLEASRLVNENTFVDYATADSDPHTGSLPFNPVLVALPSILAAARDFREVVRMNQSKQVFVLHTVPIWFSLLRILARICSEDLSTMFVSRHCFFKSVLKNPVEARLNTFYLGKLLLKQKSILWTGGLRGSCP